MSTRVYANNAQVVTLARWMIANNHTDAKAFLEPVGYKATIGDKTYNFDYKMVQLAIDIYQSLDKPATPAKPKPKRSTAKAPAPAVIHY